MARRVSYWSDQVTHCGVEPFVVAEVWGQFRLECTTGLKDGQVGPSRLPLIEVMESVESKFGWGSLKSDRMEEVEKAADWLNERVRLGLIVQTPEGSWQWKPDATDEGRLKEQVKDLERFKFCAKADIENLEKEKKYLQEKLSERTAKVLEQNEVVARLTRENQALSSSLAECQHNLREANHKKLQLRMELTDLQTRLGALDGPGTLKDKVVKLEQEKVDLQKKLAERVEDLNVLQKDRGFWKAAAEERARESDGRLSTIQSLNEEIESLKRNINQVMDEIRKVAKFEVK